MKFFWRGEFAFCFRQTFLVGTLIIMGGVYEFDGSAGGGSYFHDSV